MLYIKKPSSVHFLFYISNINLNLINTIKIQYKAISIIKFASLELLSIQITESSDFLSYKRSIQDLLSNTLNSLYLVPVAVKIETQINNTNNTVCLLTFESYLSLLQEKIDYLDSIVNILNSNLPKYEKFYSNPTVTAIYEYISMKNSITT